MLDPPFDGPGRSNAVNLSTTTSSSSSALLSSVRAERLARERVRQQERATLVVQAIWRGRRERKRVNQDLLERFERDDGFVGFEERGRALVVLLKDGLGTDQEGARKGKILKSWCDDGRKVDPGMSLSLLSRDEEEALTKDRQSREWRGSSHQSGPRRTTSSSWPSCVYGSCSWSFDIPSPCTRTTSSSALKSSSTRNHTLGLMRPLPLKRNWRWSIQLDDEDG